MGYIYKITNKSNNKVYIGQTIQTISLRWAEHKSKARNGAGTHFANAIRKYGVENFIVEQIEECDNSKLNEREIYWISYYNSFREGYNSTLGGEGSVFHQRVDNQVLYDMWDEGKSLGEIQKELNLPKTYVQGVMQEYERYSTEESIRRGMVKTNNSKMKPLQQWTLDGELVATYSSGVEAEEKTGIGRKAISYSITHNGTSGGYRWTYDGEPLRPTQKRMVQQYSLNDEFIAEYPSVREAAASLKMKSHSGISAACRGKQKTAGGFKWKYSDEIEDI